MNWVEITAMVGCSNKCEYCPQSLFIKSYQGRPSMDMETFDKIISNVDPRTAQLHFAGFSEIFLHPRGHEFMVHAFLKGFQIVLFSTLKGFNQEKALYLKNSGIVFTWVRYHEFKSPAFDRQEFTALTTLFKENIPCFRIESARVDSPISRGGSLWAVPKQDGPVDCPRMFCNVVLPNGDLALCCSDWGLRHVVGNLLVQHYDSPEVQAQRIRIRDLARQAHADVLCKTCEFATPYGSL